MKNYLIVLILTYILIRSVHFAEHLNFSYDQAAMSIRALEIWKNKEFTLVGPGSSISTAGKQLLHGSINFYFPLIFLLLGNFDPLASSYIFMLFTAVMIVPLYYGVKMLTGKNTAILITIFYAFYPLYIDFSRFFFGPNFQFSLLPLLIFFAGKYRQTLKNIHLFLVFLMIGIISQFHFATLIFLSLFYIYFYRTGIKRSGIIISLLAFLIGFSPIILFEFKNKFYNLVILADYFKNSRSLSNFELLPHRYLSLSLLILIFFTNYFKKYLTGKMLILFAVLFLIIDLIIYTPKPVRAFGMSKNWNYLQENKAFEIIKDQKIKEYNIANLIYDNKSLVIKYLLNRNGEVMDYEDYYKNKYLFVIASGEQTVYSNPAYEVRGLNKVKKLKTWKINKSYNLYLFEK